MLILVFVEIDFSFLFFEISMKFQTDALEPGKVILRGVTPEAEGSYKCEVSAEGTFHTDVAEANLTVIGKHFQPKVL